MLSAGVLIRDFVDMAFRPWGQMHSSPCYSLSDKVAKSTLPSPCLYFHAIYMDPRRGVHGVYGGGIVMLPRNSAKSIAP